MTTLPHLVESRDIIRGKIFRTAFPFLEERPLNFFEKCPLCGECAHCGEGHDYCGRVTSKPYGFEDDDDVELLVVNRFKARYAIVLSTPILNQNPNWPNVMVAPIVGIHDYEMDKPNMKAIMKREMRLFASYYLAPAVTGMHCYVDLAKIRAVPKNWLLQEKAIVTENAVFDDISERIGMVLSQRKLAQCNNCKKPCEKCEMKAEFEVLKEQLKARGA